MMRSPLLRLTAAILLLIGHFLPWAQHSTSALTQSAHDLAISTHFTPGAGVFANEWFFVPVWATAVVLALIRSWVPILTRALMLFVALGIASLGLPTYPQVLTAYANPNYRAQFVITLAVMALIVALFTIHHWPRSLRNSAPIALGLLSAVPLVGYLVIKPFVETLYGDSLGIGLGWWVTLVAIIALFVAEIGAGGTIMSSSSAEASGPRRT